MYARDHCLIATPIGSVRLTGDEEMLHAVSIEPAGAPATRATASAVRVAAQQIEEWFAGERRDFVLELAPASSARGAALRDGMLAIGYGDTISYGGLARLLESGARAIGQACARNPFPIIVPCHRVLGAGGVLGAYSGGEGPKTKAWLLDHERRIVGKGLI